MITISTQITEVGPQEFLVEAWAYRNKDPIDYAGESAAGLQSAAIKALNLSISLSKRAKEAA